MSEEVLMPDNGHSMSTRKKVGRVCALVALTTGCWIASEASAETIEWLAIAEVPGSTETTIEDPHLGTVLVLADPVSQAVFSGGAGALGNLDWSGFEYINYDGSTTGTNGPISGTLTFVFQDGPIDQSRVRLYLSSSGLAAQSTFTIDNLPVYLGDIGTADGTGEHETLGDGRLRISGVGWNHNPDLFTFGEQMISSITVEIAQVTGDGTGLTIGSSDLTASDVLETESTSRTNRVLGSSFPNPFHESVSVELRLESEQSVSLNVFDSAGRLRRILLNEDLGPSSRGRTVSWDGRDSGGNVLPSGVYWYRLRAGSHVEEQTVVLVR